MWRSGWGRSEARDPSKREEGDVVNVVGTQAKRTSHSLGEKKEIDIVRRKKKKRTVKTGQGWMHSLYGASIA